jgi:thiosulfate reductase cytochrome b subunit
VLVLNGLVYLGSSLVNRHLQRDIVPSREDLSHIGEDIKHHLFFRFPKGEAARRYNVLQKLAYFSVLCILTPLMVLAGLAMSPRMDAGFPFLLHMFDGRQSARTVHFIIAFSLLAFFLIHVFMVLVSGVFNNLRSMITGWYAIEEEPAHD